MKLGQDLCEKLRYDQKKFTLVSRTQPSGPLCLWQCFILGHQLPCGLNGALYFVEMDKDGGLGAYPGNQ